MLVRNVLAWCGRPIAIGLLAGSLLASSLLAGSAHAQSAVVVLGIRSVEGDDDIANMLTDELRRAARAVEGWTVSEAAVSMAQMSLAHGCDELDAACLSDIAKSLKASLVVYGTMQRTSANADFAYALTLSAFDAARGEITRSIDDTIPQAETTAEALPPRAVRLIERMGSSSMGGSITVQANIPLAEVSVNGQVVGETRDGALRLAGLQPGQYEITIRKQGYVDHVSKVSVTDGGDTSIAAVLSPAVTGAESIDDGEYAGSGGGHQLQWLGWTLVGVGAASAIGFVTSVVVVGNVNDDPLFKSYKDMVARFNEAFEMRGQSEMVEPDACDAAEKGLAYELDEAKYQDVVSLCRTGSTFQTLQYVFGIGAVVTGAAGAVLLLTADDGGESEAAGARGQRLVLNPSVGRDHAYVSATLRF